VRPVGPFSRSIARRLAPLVVAGAAGAAGAVLAQRRLAERRRLSLTPGPPTPDPTPPSPTPEPVPVPSGEAELERAVRSTLAEVGGGAADAVEVKAAGTMIVLRGRVDSADAIRELERAAATVPGVEGVRVLLHLPGRAARRAVERA
jgi:BON domain